jgi:hypothetical protein
VGRLRGTELVGMAAGALLVAALFLPWYATDASNSHSEVHGRTGSISGWDVHPILRWLLLLAALAPFILAYIIIRGHQLSWARGELTAVVAIAALGLLLFNAFGGRPGDPNSAVDLAWGWFVALLGILLMLFGSAKRSSETERVRKPPGVI